MRVIDFLAYCPPDHDITIYIAETGKEFFMKNRLDYSRMGEQALEILHTQVAFIHADSLKSFYITTIG